jgi:hypothetical protein
MKPSSKKERLLGSPSLLLHPRCDDILLQDLIRISAEYVSTSRLGEGKGLTISLLKLREVVAVRRSVTPVVSD